MKKIRLSLLLAVSTAIVLAFGISVSAQDAEAEAAKKAEIAFVEKLKNEGQQSIDAVNAEYQALAQDYAAAKKQLGSSHPRMLQLKQQMNMMAEEVRKQKIHMEAIAPQETLKEIVAISKKLSAALDQLQPLTTDEEPISDALTQLNKALETIKAKQAMGSSFGRQAAVRHDAEQLKELEMAASQKQKDLALKALAQAREAKYQALLDQRNAELRQMEERVKDAQLQAENEYLRQVDLARSLERKAVAEEYRKIEKASQSDNVTERLDRMEAEMSEIKVMLKEVIANFKKND